MNGPGWSSVCRGASRRHGECLCLEPVTALGSSRRQHPRRRGRACCTRSERQQVGLAEPDLLNCSGCRDTSSMWSAPGRPHAGQRADRALDDRTRRGEWHIGTDLEGWHDRALASLASRHTVNEDRALVSAISPSQRARVRCRAAAGHRPHVRTSPPPRGPGDNYAFALRSATASSIATAIDY
jgi:hypothetical protein